MEAYWKEWAQKLTFRFGNHAAFCPLFSRSISLTRSDVPSIGNAKPEVGFQAGAPLLSSGLSGSGPSHNSVRILSSDSFLAILFRSSGELKR